MHNPSIREWRGTYYPITIHAGPKKRQEMMSYREKVATEKFMSGYN